MKPSDELVTFVADQEGFRDTAYKPLPTDRWTVGYGSTYINGNLVQEGDTLDRVSAMSLLKESLYELATKIWQAIDPSVQSQITQNQFDAVCSLAYNIGSNLFLNSNTGRTFITGGNIANKFKLWNLSGGQIVQGLVNRRAAEQKIYTEGIYS